LKHLVLLGGGHAHIEVLRDLGAQPHDEMWSVTLVTPSPRFIYSGMVPGHVAGHYAIEECTIDLAGLAKRASAQTRWTAVTRIDAMARRLVCASGPAVPYDILSIDVGSLPANVDVPGVAGQAVLLRPLERAVEGWNEVLRRSREGKVGAVTVAGAGAAGIELALAMEHRLRNELGGAAPHVRVVTDAPRAAPEFAFGARRRLQRWLKRRGVGLHVGNAVREVGPGFVRTAHGFEFVSDALFWAAGSAAHPWIRAAGFTTDERGYLLTNDFLQSVSHPEVFGAGDCATQEGRAYPKAGVFAVRAAPVLAANLRAAIAEGPFQPHATGRRYLALVSTGGRHAVGVWNGAAWEGDWVWRWKDRIDRRFVAGYAPPKA
jgi:pyridine nucleotide-disulfide oxidoreductase family protein